MKVKKTYERPVARVEHILVRTSVLDSSPLITDENEKIPYSDGGDIEW